MALVPGGVVLDPQPRPRNRRGLLAVAPELPLTAEAAAAAAGGWPRWVRGFVVQPYACGTVGPVPVGCVPTPEDGPGAKTTPENAVNRGFLPYVLLGADECSVMDLGRDREGRARANLEATASHQMEAALWSGVFLSGVEGDVEADYAANPYLDNGDATSVGTFGVTRALAELEQALAECLHGAAGMVHAPPGLVSLWFAAGLLLVDATGGAIRTVNDNLVVAGSGYAAPESGTAQAFGTGMVYQRRGPVAVLGADAAQRVVRATNDWPTFVEQPAAAVWDGCCQLEVGVDMTTTGLDTAGP